jgi:hypothetical protein
MGGVRPARTPRAGVVSAPPKGARAGTAGGRKGCAVMMHLRRLNAREQRAVIDMATKLIAGAKPTVPGEVQVADDYERRLRTAARLMEIMSAAGFHCEFRHGGTLH